MIDIKPIDDIINGTHLHLMLNLDSSASVVFLDHVQSDNRLHNELMAASERTQVYWAAAYWDRQFASVGYIPGSFIDNCTRTNISTFDEFNRISMGLICEACDKHALPNKSIPLPSILHEA